MYWGEKKIRDSAFLATLVPTMSVRDVFFLFVFIGYNPCFTI